VSCRDHGLIWEIRVYCEKEIGDLLRIQEGAGDQTRRLFYCHKAIDDCLLVRKPKTRPQPFYTAAKKSTTADASRGPIRGGRVDLYPTLAGQRVATGGGAQRGPTRRPGGTRVSGVDSRVATA
jgi:hypothetical protein